MSKSAELTRPTPTNQAYRLVVEDFLRKLESMGWPAVNGADLSSATIPKNGTLGPGEDFWRSFAGTAPLAQLRQIRWMAEYAPSIFHAPEATTK